MGISELTNSFRYPHPRYAGLRLPGYPTRSHTSLLEVKVSFVRSSRYPYNQSQAQTEQGLLDDHPTTAFSTLEYNKVPSKAYLQ